MSFWHSFTAKLWSNSKNPFPRTKHVIKPAFISGGIQYFEFDTTANLPWKRAMKFISIYNELDMKCDKLLLKQYCNAVDSIFNKPKIGFDEMAELKKMNSVLKERLQWVTDVDLVYKICSVVFFDANENPDDWEWKYAAEKIERWKKEDIDSFFLHEPIQRLIPFFGNSNTNLKSYSEAQAMIDKEHLQSIYMNLSGSQKEDLPDYTSRYFSEEMKAGSHK